MVDKNFAWIVFLLLQVNRASSFSSFPDSAIDVNLTEQHHLRPRRQIDCNNLNQKNTVEEIINAKCTTLKAPGILYEFKIVEVPTTWFSFAYGLKHIEGIHFIFKDSSIHTGIQMLNVDVFKRSNLTVKRNPKLVTIRLKAAEQMDLSIKIVRNPELQIVSVAAGPSGFTGHEIWIQENPKLHTVDMDKLEKIEIEGSFIFNDSPALKEIKLGSLKIINTKLLVVWNNTVLEKFELPKLKKMNSKDGININDCNQLSTISFNPQTASEITTHRMTIKRNRKLTKIEINAQIIKANQFVARGNPLLSQETLNCLYTIKVSTDRIIQIFGECQFEEPITDVADLDNCVIVNSAVNFTDSTTGLLTSNKLVRINGDVYLADLPLEQVKFLTRLTITGKIRSDVCEFKLHNHVVESPKCPSTTATSTTADIIIPETTVGPTTTGSNTTFVPTQSPPTVSNTTGTTAGTSTTNSTTFVMSSLPITSTASPISTTQKFTTSRKSTPSRLPSSSATTILDPAKPPVGTPSGSRNSTAKPLTSGKSTAKASGSSKIGMIVGIIAGVVLLIVIITVICLCAPIPAGGAKKTGKVKLYRRVFSCSKKTKNGTDGSNSKGSYSSPGSLTTTTKSSDVQKSKGNGGPPQGTKTLGQNKVSRASTQQPKPLQTSGQEVGKTTKSGPQTPQGPSLASVSVRPPTENYSQEKTPPLPSVKPQSKPIAPPAKVASQRQAVKVPRLSYQHDLLQRMEEFLEDTENYEDLIKEVSSKRKPT